MTIITDVFGVYVLKYIHCVDSFCLGKPMSFFDLAARRALEAAGVADDRCVVSLKALIAGGYVFELLARSDEDASWLLDRVDVLARCAVRVAPVEVLHLLGPRSVHPLEFPVKLVLERALSPGVSTKDKGLLDMKDSKSVSRMNALLQASGGAYIVFDYDGNYLAWNKGPGRDFLKPDEEMRGSNFKTIGLPEMVREQLEQEFAVAVATGQMREFYYEGERDGQWCRFLNRLVTIPEEREAVLFISEVESREVVGSVV